MLLDTTNYVLMSDSVDYRGLEVDQESLLCAEAPEWGQSDALFERQSMRVVPNLPGARPISRCTYISVQQGWYD